VCVCGVCVCMVFQLTLAAVLIKKILKKHINTNTMTVRTA